MFCLQNNFDTLSNWMICGEHDANFCMSRYRVLIEKICFQIDLPSEPNSNLFTIKMKIHIRRLENSPEYFLRKCVTFFFLVVVKNLLLSKKSSKI